jgi:L-lactate dehydrogenase complex protein LldF
MNVCPMYRRAGGSAYGWVYPGPIGSVETPLMAGVSEAGELPFVSTLCGACREECPVAIDLPHQLVHLRHKAIEQQAASSAFERIVLQVWASAMRSPKRYAATVRLLRWLTRLSGFVSWVVPAWSRRRAAPRIAAQTFKEWWAKR